MIRWCHNVGNRAGSQVAFALTAWSTIRVTPRTGCHLCLLTTWRMSHAIFEALRHKSPIESQAVRESRFLHGSYLEVLVLTSSTCGSVVYLQLFFDQSFLLISMGIHTMARALSNAQCTWFEGTTADACDPSNQAIAPVALLIVERNSGSTAPQRLPRSQEVLVLLTSTSYARSRSPNRILPLQKQYLQIEHPAPQ